MAYLNTATPSHFLSTVLGLASTAIKATGGFFVSISDALVTCSVANARIEQAERLRAKSDTELAELGIKREDIVRHVFRDVFWN